MRLIGSSAVIFWCVLALSPGNASQPAKTFEAADAAYVALDFDGALAGYKRVFEDLSRSPKERARALRQFAVVSWRIRGDIAAGEKNLAAAMAVGADLSPTEVERARLFSAERRFPEAIAAAESAVLSATSDTERLEAARAYGQSVLASLEGTNLADQSDAQRRLLQHAREILGPYASESPLPLGLSEAMLGVGLRAGDGKLAWKGWQSYAREGAETGAWVSAAEALSASLANWSGQTSPEVRDVLFRALCDSQFFDFAVLVAGDKRTSDADAFIKTENMADAIAYADAIKSMRDATESYYRDVANRKGDSKAWHAALTAIEVKLWSRLSFAGARPQFSAEALNSKLRERFGAYINLGTTGGVDDLHYGHVFIDDNRAVEQYGRKASVRLISLDRLVSNGYESWVWDGRQQHGGWAESDSIIIVRPGYADSALSVWRSITDSKERAETEERITRQSAGDDALAVKDRGAFLPGLSERLEWIGFNAIVDKLRQRGLQGPELKQAFIIELNRIKLDSAIFAHEGRHVLDKIAFGKSLSSEELEFRAKLSEVAFCEEPLICFGAIFNANMDDDTSPHGRANKRVAIGIVAWMEVHRKEIESLDNKRPLLPQFDKLSAEQMRAAMRSMDPWVSK